MSEKEEREAFDQQKTYFENMRKTHPAYVYRQGLFSVTANAKHNCFSSHSESEDQPRFAEYTGKRETDSLFRSRGRKSRIVDTKVLRSRTE